MYTFEDLEMAIKTAVEHKMLNKLNIILEDLRMLHAPMGGSLARIAWHCCCEDDACVFYAAEHMDTQERAACAKCFHPELFVHVHKTLKEKKFKVAVEQIRNFGDKENANDLMSIAYGIALEYAMDEPARESRRDALVVMSAIRRYRLGSDLDARFVIDNPAIPLSTILEALIASVNS
jgi:hypothetical protein